MLGQILPTITTSLPKSTRNLNSSVRPEFWESGCFTQNLILKLNKYVVSDEESIFLVPRMYLLHPNLVF